MDIITLIENIPPAFYGVLIGSLLTIIGVVLTNISNTKRLRLQHEHERNVRNKERDLNMRREVHGCDGSHIRWDYSHQPFQ